LEDLSLHILDVVENSLRAHATHIKILVNEDIKKNQLIIEIEDDGEGMPVELQEKVLDPFTTTKTTSRIGLGIPLFAQAAKMCDGDFDIWSQPGRGTKVRAMFQYNHIDRKPWGSMSQTLITLIMGNPTVDFEYKHRRQGFSYHLDTREWKKELKDIPVNNPEVIKLIKKNLTENLAKIGIT